MSFPILDRLLEGLQRAHSANDSRAFAQNLVCSPRDGELWTALKTELNAVSSFPTNVHRTHIAHSSCVEPVRGTTTPLPHPPPITTPPIPINTPRLPPPHDLVALCYAARSRTRMESVRRRVRRCASVFHDGRGGGSGMVGAGDEEDGRVFDALGV